MIPSPRPSYVLVVDDDRAVRDLLAIALQRAGFEVVTAESGQAALDVVRTATVDLVIMDMVMPGMSGSEVVRALRARPATAILPIILITGSGDVDSVIVGLDAGADDFVPKPLRLDELVGRVTAHLRRDAAWSHVVADELRTRAGVMATLGRLAMSPVPEETAQVVVGALATWTDSDYVAVLQVGSHGQLQVLASYDPTSGVRRGGRDLPPDVARRVLARANSGPWVSEVEHLDPIDQTASFAPAELEFAAGAPIYAHGDLVGVLIMGISADAGIHPFVRRARLLAAAIDYASVLSSTAGFAFAVRRDTAANRARLRRVLLEHRFHPVFQLIVDLQTRTCVGIEALTRFDDGAAPEVRFQEAERDGLGDDFELAAIRAALDEAVRLPPDLFLSINVSPALVLGGDRRLRKLVSSSTRQLVLELTEHVAIEDYRLLRRALARLGNVFLAVDDAGAGYASLRHILELRPTYVKLDISLVRGIASDAARQAIASSLQHFASRTGCHLIAEGVELHEDADVLQELGVEFAQGFCFGRPELVTSVAAERWIDEREPVKVRRPRAGRPVILVDHEFLREAEPIVSRSTSAQRGETC